MFLTDINVFLCSSLIDSHTNLNRKHQLIWVTLASVCETDYTWFLHFIFWLQIYYFGKTYDLFECIFSWLYIVRSNDLIYKFTGLLQTGIGSMLVYMYLYDVSLLPECYVCSSIVYQDCNLNARDLASIVILVCSTFKQTIDNLLHIKLCWYKYLI